MELIHNELGLMTTILKELKYREKWMRATKYKYNDNFALTTKQLYKNRGHPFKNLTFRHFERVMNKLVGLNLVKAFRIKKNKLYYKLTDEGDEILTLNMKEIQVTLKQKKQDFDVEYNYYNGLIEGAKT